METTITNIVSRSDGTTDTITVVISLSYTPSITLTAPPTQSPTNSLPITSDTGPPTIGPYYVYGLIALAIVLSAGFCACFYRRYTQSLRVRRGALVPTGLGDQGGTKAAEKPVPVLYDVYIAGRGVCDKELGKGDGLDVHHGSWLNIKPLSVQLLSRPPNDTPSTQQSSPSPGQPPSWQETLLSWDPIGSQPITSHTQEHGTETSNPSTRHRLISFFPRWMRHASATRTQYPLTTVKSSYTQSSCIGTDALSPDRRTDIQIAVLIAMPSTSRDCEPHTPTTGSSNIYCEDIVYELGASVISVNSGPRLRKLGVKSADADQGETAVVA